MDGKRIPRLRDGKPLSSRKLRAVFPGARLTVNWLRTGDNPEAREIKVMLGVFKGLVERSNGIKTYQELGEDEQNEVLLWLDVMLRKYGGHPSCMYRFNAVRMLLALYVTGTEWRLSRCGAC